MRPEYYSDVYRRYSTYMRNQPGNQLYRIASGASDYDFHWTETLMNRVGPGRMDGLSLHYYTCVSWTGSKGSATDFDNDVYYSTLGKALEIEPVLRRHISLMDEKDPKKKVGLIVDEWGTWFDEEPGSVPGHLYQQNTMRDAMVAALTLNVFHKYSDRVRMANIAQLANVLQAMWLTKGDKLVLTPTYYVFKMYRPHQDAEFIPLTVECDTIKDSKNRPVPSLSVTATRAADGSVTLSLVNPVLDSAHKVDIALPKGFPVKVAQAEVLVASDIHAKNTFEAPATVQPSDFRSVKVKNGQMSVQLPPMSIVSVTLR